ncbi:MAG TPA: glycosyltransferase family 39 protein [Candidatus Limnocylindrales bacterium]|nr:glycosyltransferase family 39 protein [Candidatus Limnocylindrales bacterium]
MPSRSVSEFMSPRLRLIAFAALVAGLFLRTFGLVLNPGAPLVDCDGRASFVMGMSWARGMGLYLDDPALLDLCALFGLEKLGPAHHFAPGLALIEGGFFLLLGNEVLAVVVPLLLISWLAVGAMWWTTRNLFGTDAALLAAAAVSLEWTGILFGTWKGFSENLVVIALTLTLWAVLRGLRDDRFMLAAGVFAAVGYLSKASMGPFFLIAGFAGLAWRLLYRGRSVLLNGWYWAAIGIFAIPVVVWGLRNISLFWDGTPAGLLGAWQTSEVVGRMVETAIAQPAELAVGLGGKLPILAIGLLLPFLPLLPRLAAAVANRRWRAEDALGLWMTVGLIFFLGWLFAAMFWVSEDTSLLWADPLRYVMAAQVPLLWLILREGGPYSTRAWSLSFAILAVLTLVMPFLLQPGNLLSISLPR